MRVNAMRLNFNLLPKLDKFIGRVSQLVNLPIMIILSVIPLIAQSYQLILIVDSWKTTMTETGLSPPQAAANLWFDLNGRG